MKAGSRALGVAFSDGAERSRACGALVRADRVVDGVAFAACEVGGTDATNAVSTLFRRLDRDDLQYVICAGVAPAWFNVLDLGTVAETTSRPVVSVSFEESEGLAPALREHFSGAALEARLAVYESLPPRRPVRVNDEQVFVRSVGVEDDRAAEVVRAFTPEGGRPEPVRVARLAARGHREAVEADRPGDPQVEIPGTEDG